MLPTTRSSSSGPSRRDLSAEPGHEGHRAATMALHQVPHPATVQVASMRSQACRATLFLPE